MDHFYLNIIHRPELLPEYIDRSAQEGQMETLGDDSVIRESLDIFRLQQEIAHKHGLRTTIQMTYASLFNQEAIELAKAHHLQFGDEISLTFLGLNCREFREKYHTRELAIWLFSMDDKRAIVDDLFERFHLLFGFYPTSTGSYFMDAELVRYIKEKYPMVKIAVATCFEEGPRVFHNCNNSWYTMLDGGPWTAWVPSRENIHCLARDEGDDIGIVAIPHLSRDLLASIDSPGLFFGTHPQNILRGMVYEGDKIPYMFNLVDQYRSLMKYNGGFGYNMVFVGPGWMGKGGRWEASYELCVSSYEDFLAYYGELKKQGVVIDQTMSEFADTFRAQHSYTKPLVALWKDILYGTDNQVFWYADSHFRVLIEMKLGGAITDLRPYAAKLPQPVGVGTTNLQNACYPYLVHSHYRAGAFTHYAGEGAIKSCKVRYGNEEIDLSSCRTVAHTTDTHDGRVVRLEPVTLEFSDLTLQVETTIRFPEDTGEIWYARKVINASRENAEVILDEYITSCYGTTEYPEDLSGVKLTILPNEGKPQSIEYAYKCRELVYQNVVEVNAVIPQVNSRLSLVPDGSEAAGYIREGYAFSPNFTLGIQKKVKINEELVTCHKVARAE